MQPDNDETDAVCVNDTDRFGRKGVGYCFDCRTEFPVDKLASDCPNCGSDWWAVAPGTAQGDDFVDAKGGTMNDARPGAWRDDEGGDDDE